MHMHIYTNNEYTVRYIYTNNAYSEKTRAPKHTHWAPKPRTSVVLFCLKTTEARTKQDLYRDVDKTICRFIMKVLPPFYYDFGTYQWPRANGGFRSPNKKAVKPRWLARKIYLNRPTKRLYFSSLVLTITKISSNEYIWFSKGYSTPG
jgi:hypothetical protein